MKKWKFFFGILFVWLPSVALGQTEYWALTLTDSLSCVVEKTYLNKTTEGLYGCSTTVHYIDGFGRALQDVTVFGTPDNAYDFISSYSYDYRGRLCREYVPFSDVDYTVRGAYRPSRSPDCFGTDKSYSYTAYSYEAAPWGRVAKVTKAGAQSHQSGSGVVTTYGLNGEGEVRLFRAMRDGTLVSDGYYGAGKLQKTTVVDEVGDTVVSYTDNRGVEVMSAAVSADGRVETYSVHDDCGRLRWVISPEGVKRLGDGVDAAVLSSYAYRYDYDVLGRLVEKRLPGDGAVYYVYDGRDRLVLSQDGEQRKSGRWDYILYDRQNRPVEEGEVVLSGKSREGLQSEAWDSVGYVPPGTREAYRYTLYDSYEGNGTVVPHAFDDSSGYSSACHALVTGRLTAVKERVLGSDDWITTTYYYDAEGQLLQEVSENSVGGMSRKDMSYDMPGRLLWSRERHSDGLGEEHVLEWSTGYDMYGRQMGVIMSLDSLRPYSEMYDYDLRSGFRTRVVTGGYTVSESYDIRGWLAGLSGNRFFEELSYLPDGSICKVRWSHGGDTLGYEYSYDGYGRLSGATMPEAAAAHSYEERGILYDGNGNILSLQRTAAGTIVDDLSYSYSGNRLASLTENIRAVPEGDVYGGGSQATMGYSYDSNGNLLEDERRGLLFGYNGLGLLETVSGTGGSLQARYRWLADGTKLGVRDGSGENGYDYAGSFVYRVSGGERELEGVLWEGGVIRLDSTGKQVPRYFIRDHLGSVRVVVENGVVVERNDYYPFGARHERGDYVESDNRYKYNGKEEQLTGGLGWLDYGARMYDAGIGRWWSVDPLGEEYAHLSPYNYCSNIPNLLVDPTGSYLTHYVDENYNVLLQTDDGSDDVVMVPNFRMDFFMSVLNASRWDEWRLNSLGWNQYWKDEFGLAARQLTDSELTLADMFHSTWARNNAIAYFLKPNIGNALKLGISESLSQWTDPELVVAGLSAGITGLANVANVPKAVSEGNYLLYQGLDDMGNVRYIGITSRPLQVRFREHLNSKTPRADLQYEPIKGYENLLKLDARINEQKFINLYRMEKHGGTLYNKINSIAPKYWKQYGIK